jgi:hexosaminidase
LDPTNEKVYDILEKIYGELYDLFQFDTFHMGADEVNFGCWNSSESIINHMAKDLTLKARDEPGQLQKA